MFIKKSSQDTLLFVCLYVDELIYTGNDDTLLSFIKHSMMKEFDMMDLGRMRYFLGLEVLQRADGILFAKRNMPRRCWNILIWLGVMPYIILLFQDSS